MATVNYNHAQEAIDSLLKILSTLEAEEGLGAVKEKARICHEIADTYNKKYSDQGHTRSYLTQAISFQEYYIDKVEEPAPEDYLGLVDLYRKIALFDMFHGDLESSGKYIKLSESLLLGAKGKIPTVPYNGALFEFYHSNFALSFSVGNLPDADKYWNKAYAISEIEPTLRPMRMNLNAEYSVLYARLGKHAEAIEYAKKGLEIYESEPDGQPHDRFIHFVIRAYFNAGDFEQAIASAQVYEQYKTPAAIQEYLNANPEMVFREVFENILLLADSYRSIYESSNDEADIIKANDWIMVAFNLAEELVLINNGQSIGNTILRPEEKIKSLLLTHELYSEKFGVNREKGIEVLRTLDTYQSSRLHLERIANQLNAVVWEREKEIKNELERINRAIEDGGSNDSLQAEYRNLSFEEVELKAQSKREQILEEYRIGIGKYSAELETLIKEENKTLVTYYHDKTSQAVFAIGMNSEKEFFEQIEVSENFTSSIERFYMLCAEFLTDANALHERDSLGHLLYQCLVEPIEDNLTPAVLVFPLSELSYVNFEALTNNEGDYLVHDYAFSYTTSLFSLIMPTELKETTTDFSAFYPSTYGNDSLAFLHYGKEEVAIAADYFDGAVYENEAATKTAFLNAATNSKIVHIASHSILNVAKPYESYVLFDATQNDSNRLYAYEIFSKSFDADLVVLSSCNSAKGKIEEGIGVVSLSNAMYFAGVPSTVSSMWSAQDKSSSEIMKGFYKYLEQGETKSNSLRKAKLDYLQAADKIKAQPFFWANYVVYGNDKPLFEGGRSTSWVNYLIGGIACLVLFFLGRAYYFKVSKRS